MNDWRLAIVGLYSIFLICAPMRRAGYAMMLSECLLLGLFLMMELTLDFANFSGTPNGNC